MIVATTIEQLQVALQSAREARRTVGFVPTMGYLHEGHASLMREARANNDVTVLSIFVNPLQFGVNEDYDRYPVDWERDAAIAKQCGIDIVFKPSVAEMYPTKPLTRVLVSEVTTRLCGASRPGHFDGVGTVVSKLFHLVRPDRAYFGMKDAQQVAVIEQMVADLNFPVQIVRCPTMRESDGLALSSRNVYLTAEQREQATILHETLCAVEQWLQQPHMTVQQVMLNMERHIQTASLAVVDYAQFLPFPSLQPVDEEMSVAALDGTFIAALAVKFGTTRLIDNRLFDLKGGAVHV